PRAAPRITGTGRCRLARVATTVRRLRYFAASRRRRLGPIDVVPWEWSNFLRSCVRGLGQIAYNPRRSDREPSTRRGATTTRPIRARSPRPASRLVPEAPEALLDL